MDALRVPPDKMDQNGSNVRVAVGTDAMLDGNESTAEELIREGDKHFELRDDLRAAGSEMEIDGARGRPVEALSPAAANILHECQLIRRNALQARDENLSRIAAIDARVHAREAASNAYKFSTAQSTTSIEVSRVLYEPNLSVSSVQRFPVLRVEAAMTRLNEESSKIGVEDQTLKRASEITKKNAVVARERLPKQPEAPRTRAHWDFLLEEMYWMAKDMREERIWKITLAAKVSSMVVDYWESKATEQLLKRRQNLSAEEKELRNLASKAARMVEEFWKQCTHITNHRWSILHDMGSESVTRQGGHSEDEYHESPSLCDENALENVDDKIVKSKDFVEVLKKEATLDIREVLKGRGIDLKEYVLASELEEENSHKEDYGSPEGRKRKRSNANLSDECADGVEEGEDVNPVLGKTADTVPNGDSSSAERGENSSQEKHSAQVKIIVGNEGGDENANEKESNRMDTKKGGIGDTKTFGVLDVLTACRYRSSCLNTESTVTVEGKLFIASRDTDGLTKSLAGITTPRKLFKGDLTRSEGQRYVPVMMDLYSRRLGTLLSASPAAGRREAVISFLCEWGPHLVVSPTATLDLWHRDLLQLGDSLKTVIYDEKARENEKQSVFCSFRYSFNVVLTSYHELLLDGHWLESRQWDVVVLDETHRVRNYDRLLKLRRWNTVLLRNPSVLGNTVAELWNVLRMLLPELLENKDLRRAFLTMNGNNNELLEELRDGLEKFEAGNNIKLASTGLHFDEEVLKCTMTKAEKRMHDAVVAGNDKLVDLDQYQTLRMYACLRKASNHKRLLKPKTLRDCTLFLDPIGYPAPLCILNVSGEKRRANSKRRLTEGNRWGEWDLMGVDASFENFRLDAQLPVRVDIEERIPNRGCFKVGTLYGTEELPSDFGEVEYEDPYPNRAYNKILNLVLYNLRRIRSVLQENRRETIVGPEEVVDQIRMNFAISKCRLFQVFVEPVASEVPQLRCRDAAEEDSLVVVRTEGNSSWKTCTLPPGCSPAVRFLPARTPFHELENYKLKSVLQLVRGCLVQSKRCLVVTRLPQMDRILQEYFAYCGLTYMSVDGSMSAADTLRRVSTFNSDLKLHCLLMSVELPTWFHELSIEGVSEVILMGEDFDIDSKQALVRMLSQATREEQKIRLHTVRMMDTIEDQSLTESQDTKLTYFAQLLRRVDAICGTASSALNVETPVLRVVIDSMEAGPEAEQQSGEGVWASYRRDYLELAKAAMDLNLYPLTNNAIENVSPIRQYGLRVKLLEVDGSFFSELSSCQIEEHDQSDSSLIAGVRDYILKLHGTTPHNILQPVQTEKLPFTYSIATTDAAREQLIRVMSNIDDDLKLTVAVHDLKSDDFVLNAAGGTWSAIESAEDLGFFPHAYARLARTSQVTRKQKETSAARAKAEALEKAAREAKASEPIKSTQKSSLRPEVGMGDAKGVTSSFKTDTLTSVPAGAKNRPKKQKGKKEKGLEGASAKKSAQEDTAEGRTIVSQGSSDIHVPRKPNAEISSEARDPSVPWSIEEDNELRQIASKFGMNSRLISDWMNMTPTRYVGLRPHRTSKVYVERVRILNSVKHEATEKEISTNKKVAELEVLKKHFEFITKKLDRNKKKQGSAAGHFVQPHASHVAAAEAVQFVGDRTAKPWDIMQRFRPPQSHVSGRKVKPRGVDPRRPFLPAIREDSRASAGSLATNTLGAPSRSDSLPTQQSGAPKVSQNGSSAALKTQGPTKRRKKAAKPPPNTTQRDTSAVEGSRKEGYDPQAGTYAGGNQGVQGNSGAWGSKTQGSVFPGHQPSGAGAGAAASSPSTNAGVIGPSAGMTGSGQQLSGQGSGRQQVAKGMQKSSQEGLGSGGKVSTTGAAIAAPRSYAPRSFSHTKGTLQGSGMTAPSGPGRGSLKVRGGGGGLSRGAAAGRGSGAHPARHTPANMTGSHQTSPGRGRPQEAAQQLARPDASDRNIGGGAQLGQKIASGGRASANHPARGAAARRGNADGADSKMAAGASLSVGEAKQAGDVGKVSSDGPWQSGSGHSAVTGAADSRLSKGNTASTAAGKSNSWKGSHTAKQSKGGEGSGAG